MCPAHKYEGEEGDKWTTIRGLNWQQLVDALQSGDYSCVTVLRAFQRASLDAHAQTNCVTMFLHDAASRAQQLDDDYSTGKQKPPLFGIPFSVKEQMELSGLDATFGFAHRIDDPIMQRDAASILALRELGAVPFVRTNVPQGLVSFNCSNPIYGVTTHPLNQLRTPGGSSGGEAALLALGGAPFGIGTDGGGSIRIPCGFAGLAGIKPTMNRVSQKGVGTNLPGAVVNGITWGPMATSVDALASVLRHTLSVDTMSREDVFFARVPFNDEVYKETRKYRIGWYDGDGLTTAVPAMRRAVQHVKQLLIDDGHTLVEWSPPDIEHATTMFTQIFMPDCGDSMSKWMKKDIVDENMTQFVATMGLPTWLMHFVAFLAGPLFPRLALMAGAFTKYSPDLVKTFADVQLYRQKVVDEWRELQLDAVLCPVFAHPAPTHKFPDQVHSPQSFHVFSQVSIGAIYTALYNLLDFVAGAVPITHVTMDDQRRCAEEYPQDDMWNKQTRKEFMDDTVGLPVGVQCVTLPMHEERCLAVMHLVERLNKM